MKGMEHISSEISFSYGSSLCLITQVLEVLYITDTMII